MDNGTTLSSLSPSNDGSFYSDDQQSTGGFAYGLGSPSASSSSSSYSPWSPACAHECGLFLTSPQTLQSTATPCRSRHQYISTIGHRPWSQASTMMPSGGGGGGESCSICLADYKENNSLRMLPDCGHTFHVKCVDHWLRSHPTCPVYRSSPVPSPLATPLVEVTPFAVRPSRPESGASCINYVVP